MDELDTSTNLGTVGPEQVRRVLEQLDEEVPGEGTVRLLIELERARKNSPDLYRRLFDEVNDGTTTAILSRLLRRESRTYDDLDDVTTVSRQTVRKRVYSLRDLGVVEVGGNPSRVSFKNEEVRLLVVYVLSYL